MSDRHPTLRDGELVLRAREPHDEAMIAAMLEEPEVKRWWSDGHTEADRGWVVEVDGAFAGWLEYQEEDYAWSPSVGLDLGLVSALHGRGYGRRVLALAITHFRARGHHRFTIDPNPLNERAVRCYRAVGFQPVGILRSYERNPAGGWFDGLLMDLVFVDPVDGAGAT